MSVYQDRCLNGLKVQIDRSLCVGFGDCIQEAPEAFRLDQDDIAVLVAPEAVDRSRLLRACKACPVDALSVCDEEGNQLIP